MVGAIARAHEPLEKPKRQSVSEPPGRKGWIFGSDPAPDGTGAGASAGRYAARLIPSGLATAGETSGVKPGPSGSATRRREWGRSSDRPHLFCASSLRHAKRHLLDNCKERARAFRLAQGCCALPNPVGKRFRADARVSRRRGVPPYRALPERYRFPRPLPGRGRSCGPAQRDRDR